MSETTGHSPLPSWQALLLLYDDLELAINGKIGNTFEVGQARRLFGVIDRAFLMGRATANASLLHDRDIKAASTGNPTDSPTAPTAGGGSHTPGPWKVLAVKDEDFGDEIQVVLDDNGPGVAIIADVEDQPEAEANARIIAAAPELLAAARRFLEFYGECERDCASLMQAAVAKAEGK